MTRIVPSNEIDLVPMYEMVTHKASKFHQVVGSLEPAQVTQVMERQAEMIRSGQTKLCQKLQHVLCFVL